MTSFLPSRKSRRHCWRGHSRPSLSPRCCTRRTYWKSTLWGLLGICHRGARKSCSREGVSAEALGYKTKRGGARGSRWPECRRGPCAGAQCRSRCSQCRNGALRKLLRLQELGAGEAWPPGGCPRTPALGRQTPSSCTVHPAPSTDRA